jgi:hypothetical protein
MPFKGLSEQGCEDLWLFFETKSGPRAKKFGKYLYMTVVLLYVFLVYRQSVSYVNDLSIGLY